MAQDGLSGAKWLTTTQAAKLCGLCHMTIIRHFDAGNIKGFKVPGSRFRRISCEGLVEFARRQGISLGALPRGRDASIALQVVDSGQGRRALVVEDDPSMAELLEKVLASDGWEVRVARNGFDAGLQAVTYPPQLVLLDIMLPGLDGREVCRRIRATPQLVQTKVLAVTALRNEKSIGEIMAAGADAYLGKPFSLQELRDASKEAMANLARKSGTGKSASGGIDTKSIP